MDEHGTRWHPASARSGGEHGYQDARGLRAWATNPLPPLCSDSFFGELLLSPGNGMSLSRRQWLKDSKRHSSTLHVPDNGLPHACVWRSTPAAGHIACTNCAYPTRSSRPSQGRLPARVYISITSPCLGACLAPQTQSSRTCHRDQSPCHERTHVFRLIPRRR